MIYYVDCTENNNRETDIPCFAQKGFEVTLQLRINGVEAARNAGYKGNNRTLENVASVNLSKPIIRDAIKEREKKRNESEIATREERQKFWTDKMNDEGEHLRERLRASELLGRSEADFTDNIKESGELHITVIDSYGAQEDEEKNNDPI